MYKELNKGHVDIGAMYVIVLIFIAGMIGFIIAGGKLPTAIPDSDPTGKTFVNVKIPIAQQAKNSLQLYTFQGISAAPVQVATASAK